MAKQNRKHPELVKMFDSLSGSKGAWEVWNDVITMFAISISNSLDIKLRKKKREEMYMNIIKKYSSEEHKIITKICVEIARIFEKNFEQDLLGDLYMDLDFGSNALGQFFTPYSVCQGLMCKWLDEYTGICTNANSQYCADFCLYSDEPHYFCEWENDK